MLRPPVEYDPPRPKDNLFVWTVFLLLLFGFALVCWIGSYVVFSRPELPISYKLLRKIKKIDEPQRFRINSAPPGEFLGPEKLYNRFNSLTPPALREMNRSLERAFLRNYSTSNELVPYATGRFTIMDTYELRESDFVPSGVVALAVSSDYPKLVVEHIYSSSPQDAPLIRRNLQTGMDIELRRTFELSAVLHAVKLNDGRLLLTVVPINYGRYVFTNSNGGFELQPPSMLNVSAGLPIVRGDRLETASQAYVDYRTRTGQGPLAARRDDAQHPASTALKGVDVPVEAPPVVAAGSPPPSTVVPATGAPLVAKSTEPGKPMVSPGTSPPLAPAVPPSALVDNNIPVRAAIPVNEPPRANALPPVAIKPVASSQALSGGVSIQPFLSDGNALTGAPPTASSNRPARTTWTMYPSGGAPGGKNVRVNEIASLGQHGGAGGEPLYLTGRFVVRAVGEDRVKGVRTAVMRSSSDSNVRVIAEYPADRILPVEGSEVNRDDQRPYQIMDVRKAADGTINVFAREITEP